MNDWQCFVEEVSWFLRPGEVALVGAATAWTRPAPPSLPLLSQLLSSSTVTTVLVDGRAYELLAWGPPDARRGWLVLPPLDNPPADVCSLHQQFWSLCGGIVETFTGPETWWNNQNEVLTLSAAQVRLADVLEDNSWLWADEGLDVPIDPADFYVVAVEANGNLTLAHRTSGEVLLFAPDHAFDGVTPLPGCPPYSLMRIDALPDLAAWVDANAGRWIEPSSGG